MLFRSLWPFLNKQVGGTEADGNSPPPAIQRGRTSGHIGGTVNDAVLSDEAKRGVTHLREGSVYKTGAHAFLAKRYSSAVLVTPLSITKRIKTLAVFAQGTQEGKTGTLRRTQAFPSSN